MEEKDEVESVKLGSIVFGEQRKGTLPDTGKRRQFDTGSVRDDRTGKGRYDLLSPIIAKADAKLMELGAEKYSDWNWTKGQPIMSYIDSAKRHLENYVEDLLMGRESAECHLSACRLNVGAMIHTLHMIEHGLLPVDLDDRPKPHPKIEGREYNERD